MSGRMAQYAVGVEREFIATGFEIDTWPSAGQFQQPVGVQNNAGPSAEEAHAWLAQPLAGQMQKIDRGAV